MNSTINNSIKISGISNNLPKQPFIFKHFCIETNLILPEGKPDISNIVSIMAQVNITNTKVIKTPIITSLERQRLTGTALSIEGELQQKIEYAADVPTQIVHSTQFNIPFGTFIMLPKDYVMNTPIHTTGYINDISLSPIDKRCIFENIILLLDGTLYH
ncbi:DUF3794 domain-containing protein [Lutibacter sp. B2]|nr:DUF3794 domain-containing protein [Lutibacter sp. B2]